jgi:DNA-binding Xre family transcriptional regulator
MSERGLSVRDLALMAKIQPETIYGSLRDADRRARWATIWRLSQVLACKPADIAWLREYVRIDEEIERAVERQGRG